jgi:glyoxylase-like metal-dependent hydrolase (beta-lactamase superfamily II)/8-oxo-dGTP pyrophosphatase MutT (NUDIX family)
VVRDAAPGIEVLLCRRAERGDHNSSAWVFPGGVVDPADRLAHRLCSGLDDAEASARLGVAAGGLDFYIAALRECFEESGLLFAYDTDGRPLQIDDETARRLEPRRRRLHRGEEALEPFCREFGIRLAVDRLSYLSHWVTPQGRAKRFDTRFFLAVAPPGQVALHDGLEVVEQRWWRPADALLPSHALKLLTPTQKTLELLTRFREIDDLLAWAGSAREVRLTVPRMGVGSEGPRPVVPDEPAWAELGRLDPDGRGSASYEIRPGAPVRLSSRVLRVTANNGSVMTGPGTNSYFVGGGDRNEWALIDPGPLDERHVDALLAAAPGRIDSIFVTHTHKDHSPAAQQLRARTGARVYGMHPLHPEWQDESFVADVVLHGGERMALPGDTTLRVIHTPGHASNHLCYLLEEEKTLFTGDHLMQASTVVINPAGWRHVGIPRLAAGTARSRPRVAGPRPRLSHGRAPACHRAGNRASAAARGESARRVAAARPGYGGGSAGERLRRRFRAPAPVALRSLTAHLLKLQGDGVATCGDGLWSTPAGTR